MYKIFLNLKNQPFANNFKKNFKAKERKFNLSIGLDKKNYLVSISKNLHSKNIYNNKYPYLSSMSLTMKKSFQELSKKFINELFYKSTELFGNITNCVKSSFIPFFKHIKPYFTKEELKFVFEKGQLLPEHSTEQWR
jgi:hypothetical protein